MPAPCARCTRAHNWLVPLSNGFTRVQKPPLVYWTMLVSSTSVLGESEFALRLPNALATAGVDRRDLSDRMRRIGGEKFGLASAVALASMLGVWIFTHLVQPEPFHGLLHGHCSVFGVVDRSRGLRWRPKMRWTLVVLDLACARRDEQGAARRALAIGSGGFAGDYSCPLVACEWLRPLLDWRGLLIFTVHHLCRGMHI